MSKKRKSKARAAASNVRKHKLAAVSQCSQTELKEQQNNAQTTSDAVSSPNNSTGFFSKLKKNLSSGHKKLRQNKFINAICKKLSALDSALCNNKKSLIIIAISSIVLNTVLEANLRKSILSGVALIFTSPITFFFGALIIFSAYSIMYLFKHRFFVYEIVTFFFTLLAFVSFCMMFYRTTPFNSADFRLLKSGFSIIPDYIGKWLFLLVLIAVPLLIISLFIITYIKSSKTTESRAKSSIITAIVAAIMALSCFLYGEFKIGNDKFGNLPNEFKKHGFNACFFLSIFDVGMDKPSDYSKQHIDEISEYFPTSVSKPLEQKPNLVFLQLESYYDVNTVDGYSFTLPPIPNITSLKEKYANGLFRVPSFGANTANTEFEVLTGMDVKLLGKAEYPYTSVLNRKRGCESIVSSVKDFGYSSHAIHNYTGTFYDRHLVFSNLGFDTFTPLEHITDIVTGDKWAKDSILTKQIMTAIESTPETSDFVYTISVQPHGKYPSSWDELYHKIGDTTTKIQVSSTYETKYAPAFTYYVNQLHETDAFVGDVVQQLTESNEPTVLVLFGDHLPALPDTESWKLTKGDFYTTDYIICPINCDYDFSDAPETLTSYQLSSYVLNKVGIDSGLLNKIHQKYFGTPADLDPNIDITKIPMDSINNPVVRYAKERYDVQYDQLFGNQYSMQNKDIKSELVYGVEKIYITSISSVDKTVYITGDNFNEFSCATVNDKPYKTIFINKNTLAFEYTPEIEDVIGVVQQAENHYIFGNSKNSIVFNEDMIKPFN